MKTKKKPDIFKQLGIKIIKSPCKLPAAWLGCFIALKPDGTIDKKRSGVIQQ